MKDRVTEIGYLSVQPKSFLNRAFSSFHLLKFVGTFDYFFFQSFSVTSVLDFEKSSKMAKNYEEKPFFLEQLQNPDFKTSTQFITKYSSRHFIQFRPSCPLSSTLYLDEQKTVIEKTK